MPPPRLARASDCPPPPPAAPPSLARRRLRLPASAFTALALFLYVIAAGPSAAAAKGAQTAAAAAEAGDGDAAGCMAHRCAHPGGAATRLHSPCHRPRGRATSALPLLPALTLTLPDAPRRALARLPRAAHTVQASSSSGGGGGGGDSRRHGAFTDLPPPPLSSLSASTSSTDEADLTTGSESVRPETPARAAPLSSMSSMSWRTCGGGPPGAAMLVPDSVTLQPDPPHHGRTLQVNVTGTCPVSTDGGRLRVAVLYLGFKVYSYESALCDALPCPLLAGSPFELRVSQKLPALAPPGSYRLEITGEDARGVRFMCVDLSFSVTLPAS